MTIKLTGTKTGWLTIFLKKAEVSDTRKVTNCKCQISSCQQVACLPAQLESPLFERLSDPLSHHFSRSHRLLPVHWERSEISDEGIKYHGRSRI